jgi:2-dehydro-3-deoxygluconokinase
VTSAANRIVCFGEVMLRLTAPARGAMLQFPSLNATFGGAEANVAVSLAQLGTPSAFVSVLPENVLGRAAEAELRKHGVNVDHVAFARGRLGLYFVTEGAGVRASEVLYDRTHSVFADAKPESFDWATILKGASRLHISGVTPALGPNGATIAQRAASEAARLGVKLSFDGNYRATLWSQWHGDAKAILSDILRAADIAFIDARDISLVLGQAFTHDDEQMRGRLAAEAAFAAFPGLQRIAATERIATTAGAELAAAMHTRSEQVRSRPLPLGEIVDRIGSGDAYAAGLLHALGRGFSEQQALDFALAAGAWKHSIPGDFSRMTEADLLRFLNEGAKDLRR